MVTFLSAAAFKRLLEQRPWTINHIFVIIAKTKFVVVYIYRFFAATFKLWGENPHYLCRYLKVFNCHWFCDRDEVWETVNCSPVTRNFQYIIGHVLGKGQLQMNISLKQLKYFCIYFKRYYDFNCIHNLRQKQFIVIPDKAWPETVAAVYSYGYTYDHNCIYWIQWRSW